MNQAIEEDLVSEIDILYQGFKETVCPIELDEDNSKWDMNAIYEINWSCIWNKVDNVGRKCKILSKNSRIAVVLFEVEGGWGVEEDELLSAIYRLEDLTLIG